MRCRTLASELRKSGHRILFVLKGDANEPAASILENQRFDVQFIDNSSSEISDAEETKAHAARCENALVIVDHYALGPRWWSTIRSGFPLAAIDDLGRPEMEGKLDCIINQNIGSEEAWYPEIPLRLVGPGYALIRDEFFPYRKGIEGRLQKIRGTEKLRVTLTLGGSDPQNVTSRILSCLSELSSTGEIVVITGPAFQHPDDIAVLAESDPRIHVVKSPKSMAAVLVSSDVAITAGGTTVYECAFLGVPSALIQIVDNQAGICRGMSNHGLAEFLGESDTLDESTLKTSLARFLENRDRLCHLATQASTAIDGLGAERLTQSLLRLCKEYYGNESP